MTLARATVLVALLGTLSVPAGAQESLVDFTLPISVTDGANSNTLTIGMKDGASIGLDEHDELAPPPPPSGAFDARLSGEEFAYFTDIRPLTTDPVEFELQYQAEAGEGPIELSWDPEEFALYGTFVLTDRFNTGSVEIDMTKVGQLDTSTESILIDGLIIRATLSPDAPIPVELSFFGAQLEEQAVRLQWRTESETNNAGFVIETRSAGAPFRRIGFVDGAGTTSAPRDYQYRIDDVRPGRHDFRLQQVDYDGSHAYSRPVTVEVAVEEGYWMTGPAPHPVRTVARLELAVEQPQRVVIEVANLLGRRVYAVDATMPAHRSRPFELDVEQLRLPSGSYFLRIRGETFVATERITVVR